MLNYNAPIDGRESTIDGDGSTQMQVFKWLKTALIEAAKKKYFGQLGSNIDQPAHFGKTIKRYHYLPLLDRRNINDQGIDASGVASADGNLYGSSRDVGTVAGKLPKLGENGGRVNRVGLTRIMLEGTFENFGYFFEFSKDSIDFDSDEKLFSRISRELMVGANQIAEDMLQIDLLNAAGVVLYAGAALDDDEVTAEEDGAIPASILSYENLSRLDQILTENLCDKHTTVVTGSTKIDTKTIPSARVAYIGPQLKPVLTGMKDQFGDKAFIAIQHYGAATTILTGEIGSVGDFRVIENPDMMYWAGVGAAVEDNPGYRSSVKNAVERYDVFPFLIVGNDAFNTISFQSESAFNFNVITKMPGQATADRNDPYGKSGFSSIQWWYGTLINRPEWIAVAKSVAPL